MAFHNHSRRLMVSVCSVMGLPNAYARTNFVVLPVSSSKRLFSAFVPTSVPSTRTRMLTPQLRTPGRARNLVSLPGKKPPGCSTKQLAPTISLYTTSGDLTSLNHNKPSMASYDSDARPLSILLCWLMAKQNAINKYAQFYLDQGFDVLTVKITPWNLLWPSTCAPIIDNHLVPILDSSPHTRKVVHGFSVGGYIFGQLLKEFAHEPAKHKALIDSLKAQIWDSPVDVNGVARGVSKSVFLKPGVGQRSLEAYINFHMNLFYSVATKYYDESHEYYYNHPLRAPALFLCSKVDPIATLDNIEAVQECWKTGAGIECTQKIWDNTTHVGHMQRYPEEYKQAIRAFLGQSIGGLKAKAKTSDALDLDYEMEPDEAVSMLDVVGLKRVGRDTERRTPATATATG